MIRRLLIPTVSVAVSALSPALPALAAGSFGPSSDILGLRLDMSRDEARQFAEKNFTVSGFEERKSTIGVPDYMVKDVLVQYRFQITPLAEQQANADQIAAEKKEVEQLKQAGFTSPTQRPLAKTGGVDLIALSLDPTPGSTGILSIGRMRTYAESDRPLMKVLLDSLTEKYGPPTYIDNTGHHWSDTYKNDTDRMSFGCYWIEGELAHFVAPGSDFLSLRNTFSFELDRLVNQTLSYRDRPRKGRCGIALHIDIRIDREGHVIGFIAVLTNEEKALIAAKAFAEDFEKKAAQAKQDRLDKDADKKPRL